MIAGPVAWHGLGALGAPLAARLAAANVPLAVFDPAPRALATHRATSGADTARAADCRLHMVCVTDEAAAHALLLGESGLAARLYAGSLVVDHTTTSPGFARLAAATLAVRGIGYVDAPLSGGVAGARAGRLLAMLGGADEDCARAAPILAAYCARVCRFGAAGGGQAAKLANQLAIAGTLAGLDAAARFARETGIEVAPLFEALAAGSAHSAQMDQHAADLGLRDIPFGERFGWIAKDLALAHAEAATAGAVAPLADWLLPRFAAGVA